MADVVRILGLDDDNHSPMFRFEDGSLFETPRELIEFLALHHDVDYEIRMFHIIEEPTGELEKIDTFSTDFMFEALEGLHDFGKNTFEDVFELFWSSSSDNWYL
jgi:hypothetical protein